MKKPNNITDIVEKNKLEIIEALKPIIDNYLERYAVELSEEEEVHLNLNNAISCNFNMSDENQIFYIYSRMRTSKMDIANRLAEIYAKNGWTTSTRNKDKLNEPSIVFSIKT